MAVGSYRYQPDRPSGHPRFTSQPRRGSCRQPITRHDRHLPSVNSTCARCCRAIRFLSGRLLRDVLTLMVQALVLIVAGLALGMRVPAAGLLIGMLFVGVVAISLAAISYTVGLLTKSEDVLDQ
jgi:hypothetical protein